MKCNACGAEWNAKAILTACPFCGKELAAQKKDNSEPFTDAGECIKHVISAHGKEILLDKQKFISIFCDYMPDCKREKNLLNVAFSSDICKKLSSINETEIDSFFVSSNITLIDFFGLSQDNSQKILLWFISAVFGEDKAPKVQAEAQEQPTHSSHVQSDEDRMFDLIAKNTPLSKEDSEIMLRLATEFLNYSDKFKALKLIRYAAQQDNSEANLLLGKCYETGNGITADIELAKQSYLKAITLGNQEAKTRLDALLKKSQNTKTVKDYKVGESTYDGELLNGKYHGFGTMKWTDGKKYVGEFKNGLRNGKGTFYFANGCTYTGEYVNDKPNGYGTETFTNGDRYEGNYANGFRNGKGCYYYANGCSHKGEYVNDKKCGFGTETFTNGNRYEGNYENNLRNGKGTFYFANGCTYTGEFVDDKRHGFGTETFTNGDKYEGLYANDLRNGKGTFYFANGWSHTGEYKDNKANGFGIETNHNGYKYEGNFADGRRNGKGTFYSADGCTYTGDFVYDKKHGFGVETFKDGASYEGNYTNDFINGHGTYIYRDKSKYIGTFKNGKRDGKGVYYYTDGAIYHGGWSNNLKSDKGVLIYPNGEQYKGEYFKDKAHGKGTYYYSNGKVKYKGTWKDGKINGIVDFYDETGKHFKVTYEDGKEISKQKKLF